MSGPAQIFIGRQPILDHQERIVAYELLFRDSAEAASAVFPEVRAAATRVMANTFASMGPDAVLGPYLGFMNVDRETLLGGLVKALPKDRVMVELLETIEVDRDVERRCRELVKAGFRLALDDYLWNDPREPLLAWASCVKIDLLAVEDRRLPSLVRRLRKHPVTLLAEKVETREQFERCRKLGFELFQGYYFARPTVISGSGLDPARATLLQLLQQIRQDAEIDELCETLKPHVDLGMNVLRLVNSVAMARPHKVATARDALLMLGRRHLQRWFCILLYAGADASGLSSPLLQTAAKRGRLMELLLCESIEGDGPSRKQDSAFLVGMLSLADALVGRTKAELVRELNLDDEIGAALLEYQGTLGRLLELAECLDRGDFEAVAGLADELGIEPDATFGSELRAAQWAFDLARS